MLEELTAEYNKPEHGLTMREVAGGYKMSTKPEHHEAIRAFVKNLKPPLKLSLAALETLALIAYKQPITAPEMMEIRGVQGAGVVKTLLDRKLIATAGRKQVLGKPILYKTTKEFLVQFGLKDLSELPTLKEFEELGRLVDGRRATARLSRQSRAAAERRRRASAEAVRDRIGRRLRIDARRTAAEAPGARRHRQPAQSRTIDPRRPRHGERRGDHGTRYQGRSRARPHQGGWQASRRARRSLVYLAMNKPKNCITTVSDPEGRPDRDGSAARREGAGLSGGPPGLPQRRPAAAHQRWRVREAHHVRGKPRHQDLRGEGEWPADSPSRKRNSAKAFR